MSIEAPDLKNDRVTGTPSIDASSFWTGPRPNGRGTGTAEKVLAQANPATQSGDNCTIYSTETYKGQQIDVARINPDCPRRPEPTRKQLIDMAKEAQPVNPKPSEFPLAPKPEPKRQGL